MAMHARKMALEFLPTAEQKRQLPPALWRFWLAMLLISGYNLLSAQAGFQPLFQIAQPAKMLVGDKLQQFYLVTPANEVIKYSADGQLLYRYNNNTLGELAHVDATDPFQLLLYYPDFQVVLLLDRTLNLLGQYRLGQYGLLQPEPLGMSNDNLIWVYDQATFRLQKLDRQGKAITQSDDLNLLLGYPLQPRHLLARHNAVYLNNPATGVLVFDNFGQYLHTLPITGVARMQILDDTFVWCFQQGQWRRYLATGGVPADDPAYASFVSHPQALFFRRRVYVLTADGLTAWER